MPYHGLSIWWRDRMARRPGWLNALLFFSAFMTFVYLPWDIFVKPAADDVQVWFGILFHGVWAKIVSLPHWAIYAAGTYGLWRMRPWLWPWAAVYAAQVTFSMVIWAFVHVGGVWGFLMAILLGLVFGMVTRALWGIRERVDSLPETLRQRYGEWALVTGASSGIGAEFARALARQGMSVVVAARREDRLKELAAELERQGVAARAVAADLATSAGVDRLLAAVEDLEVAVLVNNAGYGYAGQFVQQDTARLEAMVQLNCVAPVVLTSRLLPGMKERGRGAVIVTGSIAGHQPVPFNGVYGATKSFDRAFGESLWAELQGSGVDVLVLEPGPTTTEFQDAAGETAHPGEPPSDVVAVALDALGHTPSVVSGWLNWLRSVGGRLAPRPIIALVAGRVMAQWTPAEPS